MIVVGSDVHKHSHTFVAVDEVGRQLGQLSVPTTTTGHQRVIRWVRDEFGLEVVWAIEDCRNYSARLERDLLAVGARVVRVPPHMTAGYRRIGRQRGKSDPIDALAVAIAALREDLPVAHHDQVSQDARALTDRRETLVGYRTATINSLRDRIHQLDPDIEPAIGTLTRHKVQHHLMTDLTGRPGIQAELARAELTDIMAWTREIADLNRRLTTIADQHAPTLQHIVSCGALCAAKLLGEIGGITRFPTPSQLARHAGIAPIPVWSGHTAGTVRLSRAGNRQINTTVHRIAITQRRIPNHPGHLYYQRKLAEGKTPKAAMRALKRQIIKHIHHAMTTDTNQQPHPA